MYTMYTTPVEKCHKALFYVGCGCVHFRVIRCTQDVHACTHLDVFWTQNSTQIRQSPGLCAVERIRFSQRAFAHASSACLLECGESTLPSFSNAPGQDGASSWLVLPIPLPPDVAKGMMVFPVQSYCSRKVLMMFGATYHQIGKPTNIVSYASGCSSLFAMAGLHALL